MRYKNIIWDWNGTILNDTPVAFEATNILLEKHGYSTISLDYYRDNIDTPIINFYSKIFDLNQHSMPMLDEEWCVLYHHLSKKILLHNNVEPLLDFFHHLNCRQTVLSAFRTEEIAYYAERFSVHQYFTDILGTKDIVIESKTKRGQKYMSDHNYDLRQTLYIGDTVHDYQTAVDLGIDCILFSGGQQSPRVLSKCESPIFDSFEAIQSYLQQQLE